MSALTDVFSAIANAIRGKNGLSTTYKPSEMATAIANLPSAVTKEVVSLTLGGSGIVCLFMFEEDLVRINAMSEGSDIQVCCDKTIQGFIYALDHDNTRTIYKDTNGCYVDTISSDNKLTGIDETVRDPTSDRRFFVIYNEESQSVTFTFTIKTYRDGTKYYYWVSSATASKPLLIAHIFTLASTNFGSLTLDAGSTTATKNRPYQYHSSSDSPTSMKVYLDDTQIATISVQYTSNRENTYSGNSPTITERAVRFKP